MKIEYNAVPTMARFHASNAFYRIVRGPVRSGKSTGMCAEIMSRAHQQRKGFDGFRKTRWGVVRNTYRELEDTTLKTWLMWFPEAIFGSFNYRTMTHTIKVNDVWTEVIFRALDRPDDVKKLLSLELTGAWVNEGREVPRVIIEVLGDRVEQFPPKKDEGCTWGGVMVDTNPPDEDHFLFDLEQNPPDGWEFFIQPGALLERNGKYLPNPKAENIENLNGGHTYYTKRVPGKKDSYVRVYYCNQYGYVEEGKRVHPEYVDHIHCSDSPIIPDPRDPVYVGLDFGLTPAATFWSRKPNGQWLGFKELATEHIGVKKFGSLALLPYILENLLDYDIHIFGDPSGGDGTSNSTETAFKILEGLGIIVKPAGSDNEPTLRRESLAAPLERMIDGQPGMIIDPRMKVFRKGMMSKYIYKRVQVVGDERYSEKPYKNFWSHTCESAEYAMVGAGEGKKLTQKPRPKRRESRIENVLSPNNWMGL